MVAYALRASYVAVTASPRTGCTAGTREARQHVGATLACRSRRMRSPVISNYCARAGTCPGAVLDALSRATLRLLLLLASVLPAASASRVLSGLRRRLQYAFAAAACGLDEIQVRNDMDGTLTLTLTLALALALTLMLTLTLTSPP